MNVGFEGRDDAETVLRRRRDVDVGVAPRVHHDCFTGPLAGDQIGSLGEPFIEEALKHRIESLRPVGRS